jgi:hypothetical protein
VNVGVTTFVTSSVFDVPESLRGSRSGVDGAAGVDASTVIAIPELGTETFPAVSSAVAVTVCGPSPSGELMMP